MTKSELQVLLVDYGVAFTDALADRLMEDFSKLNKVEALIADCDKAVEEQEKYGSRYATACLREACFVNICKAMKGENNE